VDLRGGLHQTASFPVTPDGIVDLLAFLVDSELVIDRIGVEAQADWDGRWSWP
jgi:hypothetical protein